MREKVGSFYVTMDLYKSDLWKECASAIKPFFRLKEKKKSKGYIEFIGYSRHFDFPKCYGSIALFKLDTYNGKVCFAGFGLMT